MITCKIKTTQDADHTPTDDNNEIQKGIDKSRTQNAKPPIIYNNAARNQIKREERQAKYLFAGSQTSCPLTVTWVLRPQTGHWCPMNFPGHCVVGSMRSWQPWPQPVEVGQRKGCAAVSQGWSTLVPVPSPALLVLRASSCSWGLLRDWQRGPATHCQSR